jgi:hypothetical protein
MLKYSGPSRKERNRKRSLPWFASGVILLMAAGGLAVVAQVVSIPEWFMVVAGLVGAPAGLLLICYGVTIRVNS